MDEEEELKKFKWLLVAVITFLISTYYSWQELKFLVWGQTAQATVTNTFETSSGGRRSKPLLAVEYTFTDSATGPRSERDDVPIDWPVPESSVTVQYLPGVADSSRLNGRSSRSAILIFLACVGWLGYQGFKLYKEANEAVHRRKKRR
jgi:hypothetical protein